MSTVNLLGKKSLTPQELQEEIIKNQKEIEQRIRALSIILTQKKPNKEQKVIDKLLQEIYSDWKAVETKPSKTTKKLTKS